MNREISPLRKAEDAIELDNTELNRTNQLIVVLDMVQKRLEELSAKQYS